MVGDEGIRKAVEEIQRDARIGAVAVEISDEEFMIQEVEEWTVWNEGIDRIGSSAGANGIEVKPSKR